MSVNIGPNALLLLPAGFDPATAFHSYSNLGLTHVVGTVLNVSPSQGFAGFGTLNDFVNCQGTITAANGSINLNGGIAVSGSGNVNLGGAGVSINDTTGRISGGSLQARRRIRWQSGLRQLHAIGRLQPRQRNAFARL